MLPHPFKIQKYQQNEPEFNGVYSRNNLLKIRDGKYAIRLDKYRSKGPLWIASYVNDNNVIHFDNLNIFQTKLENSLEIKMLKQIFI